MVTQGTRKASLFTAWVGNNWVWRCPQLFTQWECVLWCSAVKLHTSKTTPNTAGVDFPFMRQHSCNYAEISLCAFLLTTLCSLHSHHFPSSSSSCPLTNSCHCCFCLLYCFCLPYCYCLLYCFWSCGCSSETTVVDVHKMEPIDGLHAVPKVGMLHGEWWMVNGE